MKKIFFLSLLISLFLGKEIYAAEPELFIRDGESYAAKFISQSIADPIVLEAGENKTIIFKFKNIGEAIWNSGAGRFISAYTVEPQYRSSQFKNKNWLSSNQPAKISGVIKPGEVGDLSLSLTAPSEPGDYVERFYLAAENYSWVKGGYFFLKIKVIQPVKKDLTNNVSENTVNDGYSLKRQVLNKKNLSGIGGETIKLVFAYQNNGLSAWKDYLITADPQFADISWQDANTIASGNFEILPENFWRQEVFVRLPTKMGEYVLNLVLNIDQKVKETISLPVVVTANAPDGYQLPFSSVIIENSKAKSWLETEPRIRVGLAAPESNFIQFRSYEDDYQIISGGEVKGILPIKKFAVLKFIDGQYSFSGGDLEFVSPVHIRLEPVNNPHAVYHVPNLLSRSAKWVNPNKYFNHYRGALEYRQGEVDKKLYIVNDLLIEDYVKGMAENSSLAPLEFVKANLVAARTYALVSRGKYPFFDVLGNTYDQLYLGYEGEEELPNVVEGAIASRGMVVTYNDEIVITPYFGNSNGYTKSWASVWGGTNKPWLVPVKTSYDTGKRQNGHGVGMSQLDAYNRAKNEGLDYVALLKHYYTGVEVEKIYN